MGDDHRINVSKKYEKSGLLAGHVTTAPGLEADDDVCDLHVSLLLQVSQDSGPEEHLALPDPVQVGVQLQAFDLPGERGEELVLELDAYSSTTYNTI